MVILPLLSNEVYRTVEFQQKTHLHFLVILPLLSNGEFL